MDVNGLRERRFAKPNEVYETIAADAAPRSLKAVCSASLSKKVSGHQCPPSPCFNDGDQGAGPTKRISLSDPGLLPKLCCCIPGLLLNGMMLTLVLTAFFSEQAFYWIAAALTIYTAIYSTNLSISCAAGAWRMRRDVAVDWHAKLLALPDRSPAMHIVFLPNYKEDEDMMLRTLHNLARSALARDNMYVVLAMEEREGQAARDKAAALIDATRHLFADVFATFHPANLPGDVAGKSSNCQWAYRQVLQRFAPLLSKYDASQVFLTCCDADTLFHPQYFSAMTYQAHCMPSEERAWRLWQPPILLMRNLFSSPAPTRVSGYATIIFELAGLTNQKVSPHFSFSTYSFTLALASHHFVDGWDRDVIAEDHHMFCKCYFASIWEQLQTMSRGDKGSTTVVDVKSSMWLSPVYLPAVSYLVESDDGWFTSIKAKFVQARRHAQGVAEMSYVFLQHIHLLRSGQAHRLALSTHMRILNIAGKMASVHIIANMHSLAFYLTLVLLLPNAIRWVLYQGAFEVLQTVAARGVEGMLSLQSLGGMKWALCAIFGPIPPMGMIMTATTYLVVKDTLEGKLTQDVTLAKKVAASESAAPDVQGSAKGPDGLGWWERFKLYLFIQSDFFFGASITMFFYGLLPETLAAWSLLFKNGTGFQYIVGIKPKDEVPLQPVHPAHFVPGRQA